jgi:hypothetical protein
MTMIDENTPVGTPVRLSERGKARYEDRAANPHHLVGMLYGKGCGNRVAIYVRWHNSKDNMYDIYDLDYEIVGLINLEDYT